VVVFVGLERRVSWHDGFSLRARGKFIFFLGGGGMRRRDGRGGEVQQLGWF